MGTRHQSALPHMDCVTRFQNIPLIEVGMKTAESFYNRMKDSNNFFNWYLNTIETVSAGAIDTITPVVQLAEGPIQTFDRVVCKGLDIVEQRVPGAYLPPEMMYCNTKEYMANHFVKPIIQRASSVKRISNAVIMENPVSTFAAEKANKALNAADLVLDKYLPDESQDENDSSSEVNNTAGSVVCAIQHGRSVSKKLKRRLTKRTVDEVAALKKQGQEAVHILVYAAELILTDPKKALDEAKGLWNFLSGPEPENQARPETLEQLLVLLTRESARRMVHLTNYTFLFAAAVPRNVSQSAYEAFHQFLLAGESLVKLVHLETIKERTIHDVTTIAVRAQNSYIDIQNSINATLERLAIFLTGRLEAEKISPNPRRRNIRRVNTNNNPTQTESNGGY